MLNFRRRRSINKIMGAVKTKGKEGKARDQGYRMILPRYPPGCSVSSPKLTALISIAFARRTGRQTLSSFVAAPFGAELDTKYGRKHTPSPSPRGREGTVGVVSFFVVPDPVFPLLEKRNCSWRPTKKQTLQGVPGRDSALPQSTPKVLCPRGHGRTDRLRPADGDH